MHSFSIQTLSGVIENAPLIARMTSDRHNPTELLVSLADGSGEVGLVMLEGVEYECEQRDGRLVWMFCHCKDMEAQ